MTNQLSVSACKYKCNYGSVNWFDSPGRGHTLYPPVFTVNSQNVIIMLAHCYLMFVWKEAQEVTLVAVSLDLFVQYSLILVRTFLIPSALID